MNNSTLSLNVIFHGLCVFVGKKTGIEVLLPDMGPEHVFRAGVWLAETNIQPRATLTLEGVIPGNDFLNREENLIVRPERADHFPRSSAVPYATLALPRPSEIRSLRAVELTPGVDLVGSSANSTYIYIPAGGKVRQSTVQVFRYDVPDENRLALTNHRWIPAFVNGVTNLHIFAEPETPQPIGHSITEFGAGSAMFQGLDLRRAAASIVPPLDSEDLKKLPAGVRAEELEDLISRTKRMALLGRYKTSGEDPGLAWDDQDLFGGDPTACVWGGKNG